MSTEYDPAEVRDGVTVTWAAAVPAPATSRPAARGSAPRRARVREDMREAPSWEGEGVGTVGAAVAAWQRSGRHPDRGSTTGSGGDVPERGRRPRGYGGRDRTRRAGRGSR